MYKSKPSQSCFKVFPNPIKKCQYIELYHIKKKDKIPTLLDQAIWKQFQSSHFQYITLHNTFFTSGQDRGSVAYRCLSWRSDSWSLVILKRWAVCSQAGQCVRQPPCDCTLLSGLIPLYVLCMCCTWVHWSCLGSAGIDCAFRKRSYSFVYAMLGVWCW